MSIAVYKAKALLEKIQSLPPEHVGEVEDFVDFLKTRAACEKEGTGGKAKLVFPVDDAGPWPEGLSLRREDMYGDDGR